MSASHQGNPSEPVGSSESASNLNHSHSQSQETEFTTSNYHEFDINQQSQPRTEWDGGELSDSESNLQPSTSEMQLSKSNSTILPSSTSQPRLNTSGINQDDSSNTISPPLSPSPSNANLGRDVMVSIPEPVMPVSNFWTRMDSKALNDIDRLFS